MSDPEGAIDLLQRAHLKHVTVVDAPVWSHDDDRMLYEVLRSRGVPSIDRPPHVELHADDGLEWSSTVTWTDIANDLRELQGKSSVARGPHVCCFRFYGPLQARQPTPNE